MTHWDYCLRGADTSAIDACLAAAGLSEDDPAVSIDRIGAIARLIGYDGEGNSVTEAVQGWHANLRLSFELSVDQLNALSTVMIEAPVVPFRVWA